MLFDCVTQCFPFCKMETLFCPPAKCPRLISPSELTLGELTLSPSIKSEPEEEIISPSQYLSYSPSPTYPPTTSPYRPQYLVSLVSPLYPTVTPLSPDHLNNCGPQYPPGSPPDPPQPVRPLSPPQYLGSPLYPPSPPDLLNIPSDFICWDTLPAYNSSAEQLLAPFPDPLPVLTAQEVT